MKSTIILGKSRRLVLPKELCQRLHLNEGDALEVEVDGDGFRLRPSSDEGVSLVRERELLVATGYPKSVDIGAAVLRCCGAAVLRCCGAAVLRCCGAAVLADRDDREATLAAPYQRTRGTWNK